MKAEGSERFTELNSNENEEIARRADSLSSPKERRRQAGSGSSDDLYRRDRENQSMTVIRKPAYEEFRGALREIERNERVNDPTVVEALPVHDDGSVHPLNRTYTELETRFDSQERILWCYFKQRHRPSFTFQLLDDIAEVQNELKKVFKAPDVERDPPVRFAVWTTETPGIWNLGGDLKLLVELIRAGDREAVERYAQHTTERVYQNTTSMGLPLVTVALIKGDALGGGFEAALSCNLLIAERSAKFGLPEVMFNLFPGMGAYSLLARKIDPVQAERMIFSGRVYSAEELYQLGVIDILVEDGEGDMAVYEHIDKNGRMLNAHRAIYKVRHRVNPVTRGELMDIATIWVDAAMNLEEQDLRRMERLVNAQDRRWQKLHR
ncbi:MAG: crotonase/enoyl-CoA hydratase family protein [Alphaproteobacteria bacterium]|nr:crotonase/enoyl-CoA hydratase family protein [Alphaproteobacteria bacterium]